MPSVTVYLSEDEFAKLAYLAYVKGVKISKLAQTYVRERLKQERVEK
jgi:hypothetical protein